MLSLYINIKYYYFFFKKIVLNYFILLDFFLEDEFFLLAYNIFIYINIIKLKIFKLIILF